MDGVADEYAEEEENEMIEWRMLEEVLYEADEADDSNEAKIRYEDLIHEGIPLKPDTSYCITPPLHNKTRISSDVPCDGKSDSEDDTVSDEKNDSNPKEAVSSVANPEFMMTSTESRQEPESDDKMPIGSQIILTTKAHSTTDDLANPSSAKKRKLFVHLNTRMETVHEGKKKHVCDWTGADGQPCNQAFGRKNHLKRHIETVHEGKKGNKKRPRIEEADD